ncbi:hypothetical protein [Enterococcus malodoratus]|uniref:DUF2922 family protein n=1 Tax=Enterococcus malodoratus TaxID=71451 RepID=UPI0039B02047
MSEQKLATRQIFGMKRESLEKRIIHYFEATNDSLSVLEYAFAILLRDALSVSDFSGMLKEVMHQIFLFAEPTDTSRKLAPFFKNYFKSGEWDTVIARLFRNKKEYHSFDDDVRSYKKILLEKTTPIEELENQEYKIVSIFLDENEKRHTWSLRDADPNLSSEKMDAVMGLLTSMTIFKKEGTRLFAEIVGSDIMNCTRRTLIKRKKATRKAAVKDATEANDSPAVEQSEPVSAVSDKVDNSAAGKTMPSNTELENMSEEELREIINKKLSEGVPLIDPLLNDVDETGADEADGSLSDENEPDSMSVMKEDPVEETEKKTFRSLFKRKTKPRKIKSSEQLEKEKKDEKLKQKYGGGKKKRKKDRKR